MSGPRVFNSNGNHNHNKPYYYHFKRKKSIKTNSYYSSYNPSRNRKALWLPWPASSASSSSSSPPPNGGSPNNSTKPFFREKPTQRKSSSEDISAILWMVSVPDPVVDNTPPSATAAAESPSRNYNRNYPELPSRPTTVSSTRSQPPLIANPPSQPLIIPSHVAHALLLTR